MKIALALVALLVLGVATANAGRFRRSSCGPNGCAMPARTGEAADKASATKSKTASNPEGLLESDGEALLDITPSKSSGPEVTGMDGSVNSRVESRRTFKKRVWRRR